MGGIRRSASASSGGQLQMWWTQQPAQEIRQLSVKNMGALQAAAPSCLPAQMQPHTISHQVSEEAKLVPALDRVVSLHVSPVVRPHAGCSMRQPVAMARQRCRFPWALNQPCLAAMHCRTRGLSATCMT